MIHFSGRAAGAALAFALAAPTGCAFPEAQASPAAQAAAFDIHPVDGSVVTLTIGGIACPQ